MQNNRFRLPTLLADAVGGGDLAPGYTLPEKTGTMSATQQAGYSNFNPGVTPVSTSGSRNRVVTSTGVTPISAAELEKFNATPRQTLGETVGTAVDGVKTTLSNVFKSDAKYGDVKLDTAATAGFLPTTSLAKVWDATLGRFVDTTGTSSANFFGGGSETKSFIPGEFGFDRDPLNVTFEAPEFEIPEYTEVTDADVDAAFDNFLSDQGFTKNEQGQWALDQSIYGEQAAILTKTTEDLKKEFAQEYDRLREDLQTQQREAQRGFRQSQQALSEQSFLGERQLQAALAGRGLGGSGLAQLGRVQQQIARGEAITNLATQYNEIQEQIFREGTRASEDLTNKITQADNQLAQGQINIRQRQREEENAFKQYLGQVKMSLEESISNRNYQSFSAEYTRYQAAVAAAESEFNKKVTLANTELSNIYDDFSFQVDQLTKQFEIEFEDASDRNKPAVQEEYNAALNILRQNYETFRSQVLQEYGLR